MEITAKQAYEWVKTGHWDWRQFSKWHIDYANAKYEAGYDDAKANIGKDFVDAFERLKMSGHG